MKKQWLVLIVCALMVVLAFPAGASAAEPAKPITVWLGEEELKFDVDPVSVNGSTYVEFRTLFTALGFEVSYDPQKKSITGSAEGHVIQMTIGSDQPYINGEPAANKAQPLTQGGRTLVPLRFIGEATGLQVDWDSKARAVYIYSKGPTDEEVQGMVNLLNEQALYESEGDLDGILSTIDPSSPSYEASKEILGELFADVRTTTAYELLDVEQYEGDSAVILVAQESKRVSGGFYLDNTATVRMTITKDADGLWYTYSIEVVELTYNDLSAGTKMQVEAPAAEKTKIEALVAAQIKAYNEEDLVAYMKTISLSSPLMIPAVQSAMKDVFEQYDVESAVHSVTIVSFEENEAKVYLVQDNKGREGSDYPDNRAYGLHTLKRSETGEWLFTEQSVFYGAEEL
jgi:hypothetical protein